MSGLPAPAFAPTFPCERRLAMATGRPGELLLDPESKRRKRELAV